MGGVGGAPSLGRTPGYKSWEGEGERFTRPCQIPRRSPHLHSTNKHLKHSPQNKPGSICGCHVPSRRCRASARGPRHTRPLSVLLCVTCVRWRGIRDLQANKKLIRGFGPRQMIDRSVTRWLPTEYVGPIERGRVHLWVHLVWRRARAELRAAS